MVVGTGQYQICPRCNTEPPSQASFCYKCGSTLPPPCEQRVGSARSSFSGISQYETRSQFNSIEKGGSVSERVGSGASRQTITCSSWKTPVAGGQPREKRTPKRALIIVDLQNDFAAWGDSGNGTMSAPGRMEAVHNTNQLREEPPDLPSFLPTLPIYRPTLLPTYLPTYLPTDFPNYLPTCLPACLPACLPHTPNSLFRASS